MCDLWIRNKKKKKRPEKKIPTGKKNNKKIKRSFKISTYDMTRNRNDLALFPGALPRTNPKSICTMCPSESIITLPLWRSLMRRRYATTEYLDASPSTHTPKEVQRLSRYQGTTRQGDPSFDRTGQDRVT